MKLSEIKFGDFDNNPVLYRLVNLVNNRPYIGMARNGMNVRLFNCKFGYISLFNRFSKVSKSFNNSNDIFLNIKEAILKYGLDNFEVFIEGCPSNSLNEEILIRKYDSVVNGYNKTLDGLDVYKTKYKLRSFNDGVTEIRLPEELMDRILLIPGINIGSIRSSHTRKDRFVWMNNSVISIRVPINLYGEFLNRGYVKNSRNESSKFRRGIVKAHNKYGDIILVPDRDSIPEGFSFGSSERKSIKGKIAVNNGESMRFIHESELEFYINLGYSLGNLQETNLGKIIISKGESEKRINPQDLPLYIPEGWSIGHSYKFIHKISNRKLINDGVRSFTVLESELNSYLDKGYNLGMIPGSRVAPNKGRIKVTNGEVTKYINPEDEDKYIELGYHR